LAFPAVELDVILIQVLLLLLAALTKRLRDYLLFPVVVEKDLPSHALQVPVAVLAQLDQVDCKMSG